MSLDAIRFVPDGTTIEQVHGLLGNPETSHKDHVWPKRPKGTVKSYAYRLGCWSWVGYDAAFFVVHFDEQGRVIKAEINGY